MAATDYYNANGGSPLPAKSQPQQQYYSSSPQPGAHPSVQHLNPPYPISDAPPPYEEYSSSPAQSRPQPPSSPSGYRTSSSTETHQYPPEKPSRPLSGTPHGSGATFTASDFQSPRLYNGAPPQQQQSPYQQGPYQQRPAYTTSQTNFLHPNYTTNPSNNSSADPRRGSSTPAKPHGILKNRDEISPYDENNMANNNKGSSHSRSRSRSRHDDRHSSHRHSHSHSHRDHYHRSSSSRLEVPSSSSTSSGKKSSSSLGSFLGAGGGAIIGDAIFPGLGTIGGAILGGLGGHEYTKRKDGSGSGRGGGAYYDGRGGGRQRSYSSSAGNADDYYGQGDERRGRRY